MELKAGYKRTTFGIIPEDWSIVEFESVISDLKGGAPFKPTDFTNSGVMVLPKGGVGFGGILRIQEKDKQFCSSGYAIAHSRNQVDQRDTIIVLRDLVPSGPSIGLMVMIPDRQTYVLAQGVYGFRVKEQFACAGYLIQLSNTKSYRKLMNSIMVGSTQVHITNTALKKVYLPFPPIAEQTAISNALSDADALISSLQKLIAKKRQIKQGAMQTLLNPYENGVLKAGWTIQKFDEIFKKYPSKNFQIQTNEYLESGSYPIVDQGKQLIAGYTNNPSKLFIIQNDGLIIFGDHTREFKYIDFDFAVGADGVQILGTSNSHSSRFFFYLFLTREVPNTGYNRHFKFLKEMIFFFPEQKDEQIKIAHVLSDMDAEIVALETKLAKYQQIKQGMMQNLLTGRIRLV